MSKQYQQQQAAPVSGDAATEHSSPAGPAGASNQERQEQLKKVMGGGTHTVAKGDTLWGISASRYGNGTFWPKIRDANPDKVKRGGHLIFVNDVLEIPKLDVEGDKATPVEGGDTKAVEPTLVVTDFGTFSVYPDDFAGTLPPAVDGIQSVTKSTLEQYRAEAQADTVNPDIEFLEDNVCFDKPVVVTIAGEKVAVNSKAEAQHARRMIKEIREKYGIKVDSAAGVSAIKKQYTKVPKTELDKLVTKEWQYKELHAVYRALSHFAPILGDARKTSSRKGTSQEVSTVSKVDQAINTNGPKGKLDTTTFGEYFKGSTNFSMFTAGTDSTYDFKNDNEKQLEGVAIHEMAHGLLKHRVSAYATHLSDFWKDKRTSKYNVKKQSLVPKGVETPITNYGWSNASEDLSEAVMYYFVSRAALKAKCPKRDAWIEQEVASWTPKQNTP